MRPNHGSAPITQAEMNEINSWLRDQLKEYNDRDHEAINRHRQTVRKALEQDEDVVRILFAGSLERHTYVEGLSDVDALVIVNRSKLSSEPPQDAIESMEALIRRRLPNTKIKSGALAVTVTYSDGVEMQFLPAIERKDGIRIADMSRNRWSAVTHPDRFREKLTKVNQARAGQVIPAIKLMKGLASQVIQNDDEKIKGYHMESIAIEAFRDYQGPTDLRSMVIRFCESASEIVLEPIRDSTGQSRNVDEYMKGARSPRRRRASENFRRMLDHFSACRSVSDLDALFGNGGGQSDNPGGGGETPPRKPSGGGRTAARTGAALSVPRERRFKPPSPYATAMGCSAAPTREIYDLTPLSRANADWLADNQPGMRCDDKRGAAGGTLAMRAAWDRSAGELVVNPKRPMPLTIEDAYEIDIHLRYEPRLVPIPNRSPRVFETGGRARALVGKKVASTIDLHLYFSGEMCLGINVAAPVKEIFDLAQFIEIDVISWLYRFAYVERFGLAKARKDLWREYDHHYQGVEQHIAFLRDIASRNPSSGSPCPCGSRVKYARCHKPQIEEARRESWI